MSTPRDIRIEFKDGHESTIQASNCQINNDVLTTFVEYGYGLTKNVNHFPLANILSWYWIDDS